MRTLARHTGGAVATGVLAALAVAVMAGPAVAATGSAAPLGCANRTITTSGAKVTYTECNDSGFSRVWGTVKDTDADGQCAYVNVIIDSYAQDFRACGEGHSAPFDTGEHAGADAQVRLSER